MTPRDSFCLALDAQPPEKSELIVVLRNHDRTLTDERMALATDLLTNGMSRAMLMVYGTNTHDEALRVRRVYGPSLKSITIVTHRSHHYRAFLTFIKVMPNTKVYSYPVDDCLDALEFTKIAKYQQQGDAASYEEGLEALNGPDIHTAKH